MSRRDWNYISQVIWTEQEVMGTKIRFFQEPTMTQTPPTLSYKRRELMPYHVEHYGDTWALYFTPGTPEPESQTTWQGQLAAQGYTLVRWGRIQDMSIEIVARKVAS